jgi:hypothetical protein
LALEEDFFKDGSLEEEEKREKDIEDNERMVEQAAERGSIIADARRPMATIF